MSNKVSWSDLCLPPINLYSLGAWVTVVSKEERAREVFGQEREMGGKSLGAGAKSTREMQIEDRE